VGQQQHLDKYNQHLAELEAKLSSAYRIIEELREQNDQLQEQYSQLHSSNQQPTTIVQAKTIISPSSQGIVKLPNQSQTEKLHIRVFKSRFQKLSQWQFLGIATGVSVAIAILGLTIMHLFTPSQKVLPKLQSPQLPSAFPPTQPAPPADTFPLSPTQLIPQQKSAAKFTNLTIAYNVKQSPRLKYAQDLQIIVDEVISLTAQRGLPKEALSVTLIDLKSGGFAKYQDQVFRFPASVSKLFWMVELFAQLEKGMLPDKAIFERDLYKMIQKSDNESASRILDQLTDTTSGANLEAGSFNNWLQKRKQVNNFFESADYQGINLSQKNFPIPYLKLDEPKGRDLQMRGNLSHPTRNKMTTEQAARLMYEIVSGQAVSQKTSEEMIQLLSRDLRPEIWKQEQYNSIQGFLGESLPINNTYLASKVGWTFDSRQEVAYIASKDGKAAYILVVFADNPAYGNDWKIFPEMSRLVFNRMVSRR
jgi:myosin heavy subunit